MYYNFYMEEKQASGLWASTTEDVHDIEDIWMAPASISVKIITHHKNPL